MSFAIEDAATLLRDKFAPWVQDLAIRVDEVSSARAVLRIPPSL